MHPTSPIRYLWVALLSAAFLTACDDEPIDPTPQPTDGTVQQYGTPMTELPAPSAVRMYEVNLRAFSAMGDLQGLIARLDSLERLQTNVIWLMPLHPVGIERGLNSPYSIRDFKAVGSEYGTLADLRALTDAAHARGMAVIMDWVANHTSWDHHWITAHPDWYTRDANGDITHPPGTNWMDVADLDFSKMEMRDSMIDAMRFWALMANVDGFRCDYADGVPFDFWQQAIDSLDALPGRTILMLAEGVRPDHFDAGFDMDYSWDYYAQLKAVYGSSQSVRTLFTAHFREYASIPSGKEKLRFTTNHDESAWDATPITLFDGQDGAFAASVTTAFLGGAHMLYTGQETGQQATVPFFSNAPINWNQNPAYQQRYVNLMQTYARLPAAQAALDAYFAHDDVACFRKVTDSDTLWVIVNHRNQAINYSLPTPLRNSQWTEQLTRTSRSLRTSINLAPYEVMVLQ